MARPRARVPLKARAGLVLAAIAGLCLVAALGLGGAPGGGGRPAPGAGARRLSEGCDGLCGSESEEQVIEALGVPSWPIALLNALGLFYMFVALYIVCDEFFVPSLDMISNELNLSPDVAGATFMAAGGSAPEFFTSLFGALSPTPSNVGIAAIVGSAVFNVLAVIGACGLAAHSALELTWYPLARDSLFYLVDLVTIVWAFSDGEISMLEAAILFLLYICYCVFMGFSGRVERYLTRKKEPDDEVKNRFRKLDSDGDGALTRNEVASDAELAREFDDVDADHDGVVTLAELRAWRIQSRRNLAKAGTNEDGFAGKKEPSAKSAGPEDEDDEPISLCPPKGAGALGYAWYVFTLPLVLVLMATVPDVRRGGCWAKLYILGFALSILWIAIFSKFMIGFTEVVGAFTGINTTVLALTLLAWGTSVPDLLTSVLVTLQGHGDMAVSSSIGSNIFDVTVGLPVPWLIYLAMNGGTFPVGKDGLSSSILMLVGMLVFTVGSIMVNKWTLNRCLGIIMVVLWIGFTAYSVWAVL